MSNSYGALADYYDSLTQDVPYADFADYYERLFRECGLSPQLVLDLGCGTGTLACLLAERGFELIGADASADMLTAAYDKAAELSHPPLFICQGAAELDLFGTVDAAVSSLDSVNYIPPQDLEEAIRRLRLFIRPGGLLIFDIRTPEFLRSMDGSVSVDEGEDLLCLWRGSFDEEGGCLCYGLDLFTREGELWRRESEEHIEYAYEPELLLRLLSENGFTAELRFDGPQGGPERAFFLARRGD